MNDSLQPVAAPAGPLAHGPAAERNAAAIWLAGLAPGSRPTQLCALNQLARMASGGRLDAEGLPWAQLRYQHTQALRAAVASRYKPATARRMLSALRAVLTEARRLGQMRITDYERAIDWKPIKGKTEPPGRELSPKELRALLVAADRDATAIGRLRSAMVAVLYAAGLRRAELVKLTLEDYDADAGTLKIRGAKGNKDRVALIMVPAAKARITAWVRVRGAAPGPLFCHVAKGSRRLTGRPLTRNAVNDHLARLALPARVAPFTSHDLRRTCITHLLARGVDLSLVSKLVGHADVSTTARYDRRKDPALREAALKLDDPAVWGTQAVAGE